MAMKRVGLVGPGGMGSYHASQWKQLPVDLVGFYSLPDGSSQRAAKTFGGQAFESLEELFQNVDIVDVCTPTYAHAEIVLAAAAAGKHIVCEKPLARHLKDAEAMIAACKAANVRLFVAHVVRFFPEFAQAKSVLDSGALGKLGVIRSVRGGDFPRPNDWYGDFEKSGGVIVDLAIHDIDYLRWCSGNVERVFARGLSFSNIHAMDHALITLRFASGAIGHIEASWAFPPGSFRTELEIAGDGGIVQVDSSTTVPLTATLRQDPTAAAGGEITIPGGFTAPADDPYRRELEHFLRCLDDGSEFLVTPEDALAALKIALAAIESVRTGRAVELASFEEAR